MARSAARSFCLAASCFAALAPVSALSHTRNDTLGTAAAATDLYTIVCTNDGTGAPASLSVQVQDVAPLAAPLVSVQVRNGTALLNSTDPSDGDGAASPLVHVNTVAGASYDVLVDKTGEGAENYVLTFHCWTGPDGTGLHTGTDLIVRQSQ